MTRVKLSPIVKLTKSKISSKSMKIMSAINTLFDCASSPKKMMRKDTLQTIVTNQVIFLDNDRVEKLSQQLTFYQRSYDQLLERINGLEERIGYSSSLLHQR